MKGSLVLGKVAGIKIQVHWSFTLLLVWVMISNLKGGGDFPAALFSVGLVLVLFVCVILHELGHALMAKRFGIGTKSITMLPIGGVASLEKMPEKPAEELLVALAGPAVNVFIVLFLLLIVPLGIYAEFSPQELETLLSKPSWKTLGLYLLLANAMLVFFNLIPAFPMDGGRVLRALLGYRFSRAKATAIAAGLGQAVSFLFLILGLFFNPFLVIIAVFVYFGAYAENQMVQQEDRLRGHTVKDALLTEIHTLSKADPLSVAIEHILHGTEKDFLVLENSGVCGVLLNADIVRHAAQMDSPVSEIMRTHFPKVSPDLSLTETFQLMSQTGIKFLPVIQENRFLGAISSENIGEFMLLREAGK